MLNLSPLEQKIHSFNTFYITEYTNTYKHVLKRLLHPSFKTFYFIPYVPRVSRLSFLLFDVLSYCLLHKILLHDVQQNISLLCTTFTAPKFTTICTKYIYHRGLNRSAYIPQNLYKKMVHQGLRLWYLIPKCTPNEYI